jgi:ubiquinone/menaquinone biosynthesis C-methylase UbiE
MKETVIEHFATRLKKGEYQGPRLLKHLPAVPSGKLLEIGCGTRLTYDPEERDVFAVDIVLDMARQFHHENPNAHMILADAGSLPFKDDSFDVIVANTVLHHLVGNTPKESYYRITTGIKEIERTLLASGKVLIMELVPKYYLLSLLMFYVTRLCAILGVDIDLLDIHSNVITYFLPEATLIDLFGKMGFCAKRIEAFPWNIVGVDIGKRATYLLSTKT